MQLDQRDKELAAIGAAVGCNCRPCIEHHIPAGREAGLSEAELADAIAIARAVRTEAIALLAPRIEQLIGRGAVPAEPAEVGETSRARALVSIGASAGANSHRLLECHIAAALDLGLSAGELTAALKVAGYVQKRASEMTASAAAEALHELIGVAARAVSAADHHHYTT